MNRCLVMGELGAQGEIVITKNKEALGTSWLVR